MRTVLAILAMAAALSGGVLPLAQALPTDTAGTPGGGQSASPDGSSETRNDGRYQSSLESGLVRGAQQQCDQYRETYTLAGQHARDAEARGDQEGASFWGQIRDEYVQKYIAQCIPG